MIARRATAAFLAFTLLMTAAAVLRTMDAAPAVRGEVVTAIETMPQSYLGR